MDDELELALAPMDGSEPSFDEQPLQPGVHLRWSFSRYLSYPRQGFLIERRLPWLDEFGIGSWEPVATVKLPTADTPLATRRERSIEEATARIQQRLGGAYDNRHGDLDYAALVDMLLPTWPQADAAVDLPAPSGQGPRIFARRLELLQLAAVDRRAAVAIGLAYVDPLINGVRASYRVTGLWGSEAWPWNAALATSARERSRTSFELGTVKLKSDRRRSWGCIRQLRLQGASALPLRMTLPVPAKHVAVRINSSQSGSWWAHCWDAQGQRLPDVHADYGGGTLRISSPSSLIKEVEFGQSSAVDSVWKLTYVAYRLADGAVGNRSVENSITFKRNPLSTLRAESRVSASVDARGAIGPEPRAGAGAIELSVAAGGEHPTSVHVLRERQDSLVPTVRPVTWSAAAPGPVPEVLGKLALDGSDSTVSTTGSAAFRVGNADGRTVLGLWGGVASIRDARLNRLTADFAIGIWVYPWPPSGTVLTRNGVRRFSLSIDPTSHVVRVQVDGTSFSGRTALRQQRWEHVALVVQGQTARLYVNGKLESTQRVSEPSGSANDSMVLGGTSSSGSGSFRGSLADLVVIRHAVRSLDTIFETLAAGWSFDAHLRGAGADLETHGSVGFSSGHPELPARHVLRLDGSTWLSAPALRGLADFDTELTLEAWVRPEPGQSWPTIFGNEWQRSVWLGLTPRDYRMRFRINGGIYESRTGIAGRGWSHVAASSDGRTVRLWIDGVLDSVHAARIGPVISSASMDFSIGADGGSYPFRGEIADARVWRSAPRPAQRLLLSEHALLAAWAMAGTAEESARGLASSLVGSGSFENDHPLDPQRPVLMLDGHGYIDARSPITLTQLGSSLTLDAWIKPSAEATTSTIVSQYGTRGFALDLTADGRLRLRAHGSEYLSAGRVSRRFWTRVTVSCDGSLVRFYIQQPSLDSEHTASPGLFSRYGPLYVGAAPGSSPGAPATPFRGALADVRLFSRALTPAEADVAAALAPPAVTLLDPDVPAGRFRYAVRPTDVFGRVGSAVRTAPVTVQDQVPPPPPGAVRARFVPLRGSIGAVRSAPETEPVVTVVTDIALPEDASVRAHVLSNLVGYPALIRGSIAGRVREEQLMIRLASEHEGRLVLNVEPPPLARLVPEDGQAIEIEFDVDLEVRWAWTGIQRVSAPDVSSFRIYHRAGASDTVEARVRSVAADASDPEVFSAELDVATVPNGSTVDDWVGRYCIADAHRYRIEGATGGGATASVTLRYLARPVIPPEPGGRVSFAIPVAAASRDNAASWDARRTLVPQADRLPAPQSFDELIARPLSDDAYEHVRAELGEAAPARDRMLAAELPRGATPPDRGEPEGALLGFSMDDASWGWVALRVIGAYDDGDQVTLLVLPPPQRSTLAELRLRRVRHLRGAWVTHTLNIAANIPRERGMQSFEVAVTAADRAPTPDPRGGPEASGNESALSIIVRAIAVDRRKPPPLPAPNVSFGAADYFGEARAEVDWSHISFAPESSFEVHRATDTDVFTADMRQRRRRLGAYSGAMLPSAGSVFDDDRDFELWLEARFPEWFARPREDLFLPEPPRGADREAWNQLTDVWRTWAERYYPALADRDVAALAELPGNEAAFVSVTPKPVKGPVHTDSVRGLADNRFMYRLRARTPSFAGGERLGTASTPTRTPRVRPPRPPVFTKTEGGDRLIRLDWALSHEPNLASYRVYRAETAAQLEDLRWFGGDADARLIAIVDDPLIRARAREVEIPDGMDLIDVVGIHRLDELDPGRGPAEQTAFDYQTSGTAVVSGVITALRPIADGVPVAIIYRASDGSTRAATRRFEQPPLVDTDIIGVRDYFYRVQSIDRFGNVSEGSRTAVVRAADLSPAPPPRWTRAGWITPAGETAFVELEWVVAAEGTRCIVQRRSDVSSTWNAVGDWLDTPDTVAPEVRFVARDRTANPERTYQYRVRVISPAGNPNAEHSMVDVPPLEA